MRAETNMKKILVPLFVLAVLSPLAGCVSPYYYDRYGYDGYYGGGERYAPYGDGYNPYYDRGHGGYGYGRYGYDDGYYR
jgi:hypothetical protein